MIKRTCKACSRDFYSAYTGPWICECGATVERQEGEEKLGRDEDV